MNGTARCLPKTPRARGGLVVVFTFLAGLFVASCGGEDIVIYCALDRNFSEPLIKEFEKRTGLKVEALFDVEAHKTVGLVRKIKEEMDTGRVRCDIFWNNEIANTIKLKNLGALAPYISPNAADIPARFKDSGGYWAGFAARARVLIVNTELLPDPDKRPGSFEDLVSPEWKGKGGIAKPLTGTTASRGAVLFQKLGAAGAEAFFERIIEMDVYLTPGNANLMKQVRKGKYAFGFTDTDDFNVARADGYPVAAVYPDQGEGQMGTLVIPNTVALIKNGPHPEAAKKLIDYILSKEVEERLAHSSSAQIPLHPGVKTPDHVKVPGKDFRPMEVDFEQAAKDFDRCQAFFRTLFIQ